MSLIIYIFPRTEGFLPLLPDIDFLYMAVPTGSKRVKLSVNEVTFHSTIFFKF